jgi:hypothetical protein
VDLAAQRRGRARGRRTAAEARDRPLLPMQPDPLKCVQVRLSLLLYH